MHLAHPLTPVILSRNWRSQEPAYLAPREPTRLCHSEPQAKNHYVAALSLGLTYLLHHVILNEVKDLVPRVPSQTLVILSHRRRIAHPRAEWVSAPLPARMKC